MRDVSIVNGRLAHRLTCVSDACSQCRNHTTCSQNFSQPRSCCVRGVHSGATRAGAHPIVPDRGAHPIVPDRHAVALCSAESAAAYGTCRTRARPRSTRSLTVFLSFFLAFFLAAASSTAAMFSFGSCPLMAAVAETAEWTGVQGRCASCTASLEGEVVINDGQQDSEESGSGFQIWPRMFARRQCP